MSAQAIRAPGCMAKVAVGSWHMTLCSRRATTTRLDHGLCTQHARVFDSWVDRQAEKARLRWGWK